MTSSFQVRKWGSSSKELSLERQKGAGRGILGRGKCLCKGTEVWTLTACVDGPEGGLGQRLRPLLNVQPPSQRQSEQDQNRSQEVPRIFYLLAGADSRRHTPPPATPPPPPRPAGRIGNSRFHISFRASSTRGPGGSSGAVTTC